MVAFDATVCVVLVAPWVLVSVAATFRLFIFVSGAVTRNSVSLGVSSKFLRLIVPGIEEALCMLWTRSGVGGL